MSGVGFALYGQHRDAEAEKLLQKGVEAQRRVLKPDDPSLAVSLRHLGSTLEEQGHYAEAEKSFGEALAIDRRALGLDAPDTLAAEDDLGGNLLLG